VAHRCVDMRTDVDACRYLAYQAAWAVDHADAESAEAAVSAAKSFANEAMRRVQRSAHQVHGAIGFTIEHILHRYTLRALAWRDDFGSESYWAVELGKLVAARGADELWPLVASR